jgi:glyoxylase-like metal-dependent hydrolase (beta-lactamase superfamily II)
MVMSTRIISRSGSKHTLLLKSGIAILILATVLLVTSPALAQAKPAKVLEIKVHQEPGGVTRFEEYVTLSPELGAPPGSFYKVNVYAIGAREGIVLVDCGVESLYPDLMREIDKRFPNRPLLAVLLTHGHADHAGAGHYFLEAGVPVYASAADAYLIQMGMNFPGVPSDFSYTGYTPTGLLYGDETLFGLKVIPTPGHTYGSLSFLDTKGRVLFSGDTTLAYAEDDQGPLDLTYELEYMTMLATDKDSLQLQTNSLNLLLDLVNQGTVKAILPGHNKAYHGKDVIPFLQHSIDLVAQALSLN